MYRRIIFITFAISLFATGYIAVNGQILPDPPSMRHKEGDNERSQGFEEQLVKMRIQKDKKDHDELVAHGLELNQIMDELGKSFEANGRLSDKDMSKLAAAEKLAKKIRNDLGGSDDDGDGTQPGDGKKTNTVAEAVKAIESTSEKLFNELKRSTRFTISVTAIQTSNAVIRLARSLRVRN